MLARGTKGELRECSRAGGVELCAFGRRKQFTAIETLEACGCTDGFGLVTVCVEGGGGGGGGGGVESLFGAAGELFERGFLVLV